MTKSRNNVATALLGLFVFPGVAQANAGLPMIILVMPALTLSIIPIIIIEATYISRQLALRNAKATIVVTMSNLASTVVGVPLTWLILVVIQVGTGGGSAYGLDSALGVVLAVTWQAPWLIPYGPDLDWMIPVAGLVLLIPFFFVSWWLEYYVTAKMLTDIEKSVINHAVRNANLITYGLLALWPIVFLAIPDARIGIYPM